MHDEYDHYLALDWAQNNMAVARMSKIAKEVKTFEGPADVKDLKVYLATLKGRKILAFEETTTAHWLYTELVDCVDRVIVCDPWRNRLLKDGPKTDKLDASKLVQLLRANFLKEVFHAEHEFVFWRKLVSGYEDLIQSGIRLKNQRHALIRAVGKRSSGEVQLNHPAEQFVLQNLERRIQGYEEERKQYLEEFKKLAKKYQPIRLLKTLPGIDLINAVKIVVKVIAPHRFPDKGHYLSYCGLIKLDRLSGGKSYGRKNPRYSRALKCVYKTAAISAIHGENPMHDYYEYLLSKKNYSEDKARHAVARRIAVLSWGVFKSGKEYEPKKELN